jgi:hypothetical protein
VIGRGGSFQTREQSKMDDCDFKKSSFWLQCCHKAWCIAPAWQFGINVSKEGDRAWGEQRHAFLNFSARAAEELNGRRKKIQQRERQRLEYAYQEAVPTVLQRVSALVESQTAAANTAAASTAAAAGSLGSAGSAGSAGGTPGEQGETEHVLPAIESPEEAKEEAPSVANSVVAVEAPSQPVANSMVAGVQADCDGEGRSDNTDKPHPRWQQLRADHAISWRKRRVWANVWAVRQSSRNLLRQSSKSIKMGATNDQTSTAAPGLPAGALKPVRPGCPADSCSLNSPRSSSAVAAVARE